jgi:hypothetical protein
MERDTLDPTYSSFLIKFGGKDVRVIDSIAPLRKGEALLLVPVAWPPRGKAR